MKKIVLTFGLISGLALSAMMLASLPFHDRMSLDTALFVGYASMVAASLLIFFGVRRYRDHVAGGATGFGRLFAVGMLIVAVSSAVYTVTWEIVYFGFDSPYLEQYQARAIAEERERGATPAKLDSMRVEMEKWAVLYQNPAINAALTFMEPLPVGLVMSLLSAAVLRRRRTALAEGAIGAGRAVA